jgi:hypothetical protein
MSVTCERPAPGCGGCVHVITIMACAGMTCHGPAPTFRAGLARSLSGSGRLVWKVASGTPLIAAEGCFKVLPGAVSEADVRHLGPVPYLGVGEVTPIEDCFSEVGVERHEQAEQMRAAAGQVA